MLKHSRLLILVLGAVAFVGGVVVVCGPPVFKPPQFQLFRDKEPRMLPITTWEDVAHTGWQVETKMPTSEMNFAQPVATEAPDI